MKKFIIKTLGCKVNQYDSLNLKNLLLKQGLVYSIKNPDFVIINTCAVTKVAIRKDWQACQILKKKYPKAKIVIFGCWPQIYNSDKFKEAYLVANVGNLENLAKKISQSEKLEKKADFNFVSSNEKNRYFLKIADGCNQFCSYCIIPLSRGPLKSRKISQVIKEAKEAEKQGYEEVVLTAIHLGAYGKDFKQEKFDLYKLLKELLKETKNIRFRLSSIELNEINLKLINLISSSKGRICRHLHIPLQSGSDKILKLMKRPYNSDFFKKRLELIRSKIPKIAITTDIIVAFPSESDKDFQETYKLAEELAFSKIHVFPFSEHELTSASKLKEKVDAKTKKQRSAVLRKLSDELSGFYKAKMLSGLKNLNLLIEKKEKGVLLARSEFYFTLKFKLKNKKIDKIKVGQLVKVNREELIIID